MKVLVVDDEAAMREVCRDILNEEGWEVVEAGDGPSGVALARAEHPDAIVLDVVMPRMDGFQVAEQLVADETTTAIPIVFLTARAGFTDQLRGYEAGGIEYITKPFDLTHFVALLRRVVAHAPTGVVNDAGARHARIGALRILLGIA